LWDKTVSFLFFDLSQQENPAINDNHRDEQHSLTEHMLL